MLKNKAVVILGVIVLLVAAFFIVKGLGLFGMGSMKSQPPSNFEIPANTVIVQGNSFNPDTLNVKVGTKVTWINNDSYAHTVTGDNGVFDSGNLASGQSYSFTFDKAGTYSYHCSVHTFMVAKVVVSN